MNLKELRLDVEALFSQSLFGHGFLHYGYWPNGVPENPSLDKLGKAQQSYFDRLVEMVPGNIQTILDVGSGTGSNAMGLIKKGFKVDCVCPSEKLNQMAREKLPQESIIYECGFENFANARTYDMLLFCESFHYIQSQQALAQAEKYTSKYVLIFDYFRNKNSNKKDRITYGTFLEQVKNSPFEIIHDEDVTEAIRPTFLVLDLLKNEYLKPFSEKVLNDYRRDHPFYSFLLKRPIKKLTKNIQKPSRRFDQFPKKHQYRLIILKKK